MKLACRDAGPNDRQSHYSRSTATIYRLTIIDFLFVVSYGVVGEVGTRKKEPSVLLFVDPNVVEVTIFISLPIVPGSLDLPRSTHLCRSYGPTPTRPSQPRSTGL